MASYAYTVGIQQMVISAIILTVTLAFLSDDHLNYFNEKLEKWSNLMWIILHLLLPTSIFLSLFNLLSKFWKRGQSFAFSKLNSRFCTFGPRPSPLSWFHQFFFFLQALSLSLTVPSIWLVNTTQISSKQYSKF